MQKSSACEDLRWGDGNDEVDLGAMRGNPRALSELGPLIGGLTERIAFKATERLSHPRQFYADGGSANMARNVCVCAGSNLSGQRSRFLENGLTMQRLEKPSIYRSLE